MEIHLHFLDICPIFANSPAYARADRRTRSLAAVASRLRKENTHSNGERVLPICVTTTYSRRSKAAPALSPHRKACSTDSSMVPISSPSILRATFQETSMTHQSMGLWRLRTSD